MLNFYTQGQGSPVLCLHGHPGNAASMAVFTDHLSNRFLTLTPDLRGYGKSKQKTAFTMETHIEDLEALLEPFDDVLVLGWSLGGILALELALRHPNRVKGLILIATAANPRSNHPTISWQDNLLTGISGLINWLIPAWEWNIQQLGKRSLFRYLLKQHTAYAYQRLAKEGVAAYFQTSTFATQALSQAIRQGYNRIPDIQQIQVPCLMLCGESDRHITARASQETAQNLSNCEYLCYANTAHLLPWEIPTQIGQDIDKWLEKHHFS